MDEKSPKKPPILFNGNEHGIPYSATNQPSPEAKSEGWKKKRAQRLLTQEILKVMDGQTLTDYVQSLVTNAKLGNVKAIETINKGIEEEIQKIEVTQKKAGKDLADEDYV